MYVTENNLEISTFGDLIQIGSSTQSYQAFKQRSYVVS